MPLEAAKRFAREVERNNSLGMRQTSVSSRSAGEAYCSTRLSNGLFTNYDWFRRTASRIAKSQGVEYELFDAPKRKVAMVVFRKKQNS